jgi:prepilin-type N-terminal cleavage/methylation domain-containing protein
MKQTTRKNSAGFTLIEIIVTMIVLSIITVICSRILGAGLTSYVAAQNISDADWQMRIALESMTREIRNIRSDSDITAATATTLSFTDNFNSAISYTYSGNTILQNSQILADGVTAFAFTYYTNAAVVTTTASAVSAVQLNVTFAKNNTSNFTTQVIWFPRNTIP